MSWLRGSTAQGESRSFTLQQLGAQIAAQRNSGYIPAGVESALRDDAVWAVVDIIASSISALPVDALRKQGESRLPIEPQPSLIVQPSAVSTLDVWLYQLAQSLTTDGNGFGYITKVDALGRPLFIELINPAQVTDRRVVDGVGQVLINDEKEKFYPNGRLWHVPGKMVQAGSPFGLSPVEYASNSIRAALSAEQFGFDFFRDGAHPTHILSAPFDPGKEQADLIVDRFVDSTKGARRPAFVGADIKVDQLSVNPGDSQFLDLQRFAAEQVARRWRVPPAMVYAATSGQSVTYANISQSDLHYLKHSLDGYLVRIESALTALLARPQFVKFNRNALLRADAETRNRIYDTRIKNGSMLVNEVREHEDERPLTDAELEAAKPKAAPIASTEGQNDDVSTD